MGGFKPSRKRRAGKLWDATSGKALQTLEGHSNRVFGIAWSPDGERLASASGDHTIRLWDAVTGQHLETLEVHTNEVRGLVFSPNGQLLASTAWDGTNQIRRCDNWDLVGTLNQTSNSPFRSIAFHPHLSMLATLDQKDTVIFIWELDEALLLSQSQESVNYTTAKLVLVGDSRALTR